MGIYKTMGFSTARLRRMFALRFGITALVGSILGTGISTLLTDPIVDILMRMEGISNFSSNPDIRTIVLPGICVAALSFVFAWMFAGKIKRTPVRILQE